MVGVGAGARAPSMAVVRADATARFGRVGRAERRRALRAAVGRFRAILAHMSVAALVVAAASALGSPRAVSPAEQHTTAGEAALEAGDDATAARELAEAYRSLDDEQRAGELAVMLVDEGVAASERAWERSGDAAHLEQARALLLAHAEDLERVPEASQRHREIVDARRARRDADDRRAAGEARRSRVDAAQAEHGRRGDRSARALDPSRVQGSRRDGPVHGEVGWQGRARARAGPRGPGRDGGVHPVQGGGDSISRG